MVPTIQQIMTSLIRKTGEPTAPILIQNLYSALGKSKHIFKCTKADVQKIQERLMKDFPDAELNELCIEPAFIVALTIMLKTSLKNYGKAAVRENA